ncbi:predicted protein [Botrytis cinerea T4]|uniref:Uncharacterized protein n=1 Tax=Botryotinia fuckeliana (strain T4) TaxID=999810 RepID=G2YFV8_BOTF4|nr:predicted protein [Botrytis cinerea T4]
MYLDALSLSDPVLSIRKARWNLERKLALALARSDYRSARCSIRLCFFYAI